MARLRPLEERRANLWLMMVPEGDALDALVAPHAQCAKFAPEHKAVADVTERALFVRRVLRGAPDVPYQHEGLGAWVTPPRVWSPSS